MAQHQQFGSQGHGLSQSVISISRKKKTPSDPTKQVKQLENQQFLTWLSVELTLETEWEQVQLEAFKVMMKRKQRFGTGEKQSDVITVQPYDENRVELRAIPIPAEEDLTFINASFVDNGNYIAAAMPQNLPSERDFWRMTYEHNVQSIVMLNKPTERKKNPYWPNKTDRIRSYGDVVKVVLLHEEYASNIYCWVRKFQVLVNPKYYKGEQLDCDDELLATYDYNFKGKEELSELDRTLMKWSVCVTHLQYDDWDDMRVPDDKKVFYQFMYMACKQHEDTKSRGPMVVHCFGGVGRTGTFLVIHSIIQKMTRLGGKAMNILDILGMMRQERSSLVQTAVSSATNQINCVLMGVKEQYKFCYRMIWQFYEERRFFTAALVGLKEIGNAVKNQTLSRSRTGLGKM